MTAFSTMRYFGDNFVNQDVARQISLFLDQKEKCSMSASANGVHQALKKYLPTSEKYVTTVKPNLMSVFTTDNGIYSSPIDTFQISEYGNFGNFYQSMITHVGANENKDYYAAWYENMLNLRKGGARYQRGNIDLYISDIPEKDEKFLVERLLSSSDTSMTDHDCLQYTKNIMEAVMSNASIVDLTAYSQTASCRCNLFRSISKRSTDLVKLNIVGDTCDDTIEIIAESCVEALTNLSITTGDSSDNIMGTTVDIICDAVADFGLLEVLEIGNVASDNEEWADGLIRVLNNCPVSSLRINETYFEENCAEKMSRALTKLVSHDVKMTSCDFGKWGTPIFDALFSNKTIQWLDISFTEIGNDSINSLVDMIKRGVLTKLAIGHCGIGREGIKAVLQATTHDKSRLDFISIFDNDIDDPKVFQGMEESSLWTIHVGEIKSILGEIGHMCEIDERDSDECFNDGEGVYPWKTKSHMWTMGGDSESCQTFCEMSDESELSDHTEKSDSD